ncbi:MAG: long-chain fatty acid--CoA ligase [Acidobacteriota bacterium]
MAKADHSSSSAPTTLSGLLFHIREHLSGRPDLLETYRPGSVESLSAPDFLRQVHALAVTLEGRGVVAGERLAIYSENRPEWPVVDFAGHLLAVPVVPISPATPPEHVAFILRNSGARWVFYSGASKRDVLLEVFRGLTAPPRAIAFEADAAMPESGETLTRLLGEGTGRLAGTPMERFRGRAREDGLATLLYTSGTTGDPKGVMLSHANLMSNVVACGGVFDLGPEDRAASFLPLAQVFQRTVDYLCFWRGAGICYIPDPATVGEALRHRRPTVMAAAPALYQRAYGHLRADIEGQSPLRRRLFEWAFAIGRRYAEASRDGFIGPLLALQCAVARRVVHRKILERFGGRLRLAISGGAPLPEEIAIFFDAVGMPLYEGYGLTETSPVLATNTPEEHRLGSVGKPLSDVELRIAEDGEILVRGPGVMQGYWQNEGATAENVSESGWFRTGDLGRMDKSGYVFITDRKKDLIVLSSGENIAPRPIEGLLVQGGWVEQAVVVGDGRPHTAALLVPGARLRSLVTGGADDDEAVLADHPQVKRHVQELIDAVNGRVAGASQIKAWRLIDRPFTVETGELTPTLKLRRRVIAQRFAREIAELYR